MTRSGGNATRRGDVFGIRLLAITRRGAMQGPAPFLPRIEPSAAVPGLQGQPNASHHSRASVLTRMPFGEHCAESKKSFHSHSVVCVAGVVFDHRVLLWPGQG